MCQSVLNDKEGLSGVLTNNTLSNPVSNIMTRLVAKLWHKVLSWVNISTAYRLIGALVGHSDNKQSREIATDADGLPENRLVYKGVFIWGDNVSF